MTALSPTVPIKRSAKRQRSIDVHSHGGSVSYYVIRAIVPGGNNYNDLIVYQFDNQ